VPIGHELADAGDCRATRTDRARGCGGPGTPQELADVIARESVRELRQVVRAEREELRFLGDLGRVSALAAPRIIVPTRYGTFTPISFITASATRTTDAFWSLSSRTSPTSGIMISGNTFLPSLAKLAGRFDNRARLHLRDLGIRDAEAHATMAEHRIELVQLLHALAAASSSPAYSGLPALPVAFHRRLLHHQVLRASAGTRATADRSCESSPAIRSFP
jgi:hypothetical protein